MRKFFYDTEFLEGIQKSIFGGKPTIDLISIGIVDENGSELYEVSKDFNLKEAWNRYDVVTETYSGDLRNIFPEGKEFKVYWIRENVLIPIFFELAERDFHYTNFKDEWMYEQEPVTLEVFKKNEKWTSDFKWFKKLINKYGKTNKEIAQEVFEFISKDSITIEKAKHYNVSYKNQNIKLYGYYSAYDHVVFSWLFGKMIDLPEGFPMYTIDLKQTLDELAEDEIKSFCYATGNHTVLTKEEALNIIKSKHDYPKQMNNHHALDDARWNYKFYKFLHNL